MLKLYSTLTRKKEALKPIHKDWVGLYTCGPTVYNYAHIGNLRTYIFEDILERVLRYNGHEVRRVMNTTDVGHLTGDSDSGEEKLDIAARAEKKSPEEIAAFYTKAFFDDIEKLNILKPEVIAPATKFVREQIAVIETLFERGFAYQTSNAVYFDVGKFKDYGKLSGQSLKEKMTGARGEVVVDKEKRNPADFALWFKLSGKFKNHLLRWPSPWGDGFPGWHIECSAISRHFLGQPFDIHTGGVDHVGTHHTNEIAQSEAAYGVSLANIWMHGEHLLINEGKMAKSEGNFLTLAELEKKGYHPLVFRYLVLGAHYKTKINFTLKSLDGARNGLQNLYESIYSLARRAEDPDDADIGNTEKYEDLFANAANDDLNIPQALAALQDMLQAKDVSSRAKLVLAERFDRVFGLDFATPMKRKPDLPASLLDRYTKSRDNKQFIQSDALRKEIESLGYIVRDTKTGPMIVPKFF